MNTRGAPGALKARYARGSRVRSDYSIQNGEVKKDCARGRGAIQCIASAAAGARAWRGESKGGMYMLVGVRAAKLQEKWR